MKKNGSFFKWVFSNKNDTKLEKKIKFNRGLFADIEYALHKCKHIDTKKNIEDLLLEAKQCKVAASKRLGKVEIDIKNSLLSLICFVENDNYVYADFEIAKLRGLIEQRENLCEEYNL